MVAVWFRTKRFSRVVSCDPHHGQAAVGRIPMVANRGRPRSVAAGAGGAKPLSRSLRRPSGVIRSEVQGTAKVISTSTTGAMPASRSATEARISSRAGQPTKVGSSSTRSRRPSSSTAWTRPRSTTDTTGISGSGTSASASQTSVSLTVLTWFSPDGLRVGAADHGELLPQPAEVAPAVGAAAAGGRGGSRRARQAEAGQLRGQAGQPATPDGGQRLGQDARLDQPVV